MKRGSKLIRIFSLLTILLLILIMAVASTFSWYNPTVYEDTGNALYYNIEGKVNRISGCEFKSYKGSEVDGLLIYDDIFLMGYQSVSITDTDEVVRYKTVIKNDNNGPAMISLYVSTVSSTDGNAYVGVYSPEKTYIKVKADSTPVCIEDNIIVPNNGTVEVYWYVGADEVATVTFGDLFIAYN